jgi:hypothetical protein
MPQASSVMPEIRRRAATSWPYGPSISRGQLEAALSQYLDHFTIRTGPHRSLDHAVPLQSAPTPSFVLSLPVVFI